MATSESTPSLRPVSHRRPAIVGPIILIGLGALFLAQNLGYVNSNFWFNVWRLWPVLLVLVGVELIFGRMGWGGALVTVLVALFALAAVAWAAVIGTVPYWNGANWSIAASATQVEQLNLELGGARQAVVDLRHGAGSLTVAALNDDGGNLIEANLARPESSYIYRQVDRSGDTATIRLQDPDGRDFPFINNNYRLDWQVLLSPAVATDLKIETGASALDLDLHALAVRNLTLQTGASAVKVTLPEAAGRTSATIKAGMASVDVFVPEGVAARINAKSGMSGVDIDQGRFPHYGGYYQSPNYDTATNRVDLYIETGMASVNVH